MATELPPLPFDYGDLEPFMSSQTLHLHHDKHHSTYVVNYNNLVRGTELDDRSLEDVIKAVAGDASKVGVFNNAAQVWNHTFFWSCLKRGGGGRPTGALLAKIEADFGSFDKFAESLKNAALTQFGSGWAWLVLEDGRLSVTKTANADTPLARGQTPLFTVDVWEHAYYVDYQNRRGDFVTAVLNNLANWEFVAEQLARATGG